MAKAKEWKKHQTWQKLELIGLCWLHSLQSNGVGMGQRGGSDNSPIEVCQYSGLRRQGSGQVTGQSLPCVSVYCMFTLTAQDPMNTRLDVVWSLTPDPLAELTIDSCYAAHQFSILPHGFWNGRVEAMWPYLYSYVKCVLYISLHLELKHVLIASEIYWKPC